MGFIVDRRLAAMPMLFTIAKIKSRRARRIVQLVVKSIRQVRRMLANRRVEARVVSPNLRERSRNLIQRVEEADLIMESICSRLWARPFTRPWLELSSVALWDSPIVTTMGVHRAAGIPSIT